MGCCPSKPSDDSTVGNDKKQSASKPAAVSPLDLSEWSTITDAPMAQELVPPSPLPRGRNNSVRFGGRPNSAKKMMMNMDSLVASSFSFDQKDTVLVEINQGSPLRSDIWSVANSVLGTPTRQEQGFEAAETEYSSEIWSINDAPPSITFLPMGSPAIKPNPITQWSKHESSIENDMYLAGSPIKRQSPYLAGRGSNSETEQSQPVAVALSPLRQERERGSNSPWNVREEQEKGYGRRSPATATADDRLKGENGVASLRERGNESSDGCLSIEGFVFS